jgi:cellulose synthase/poly-beta-1,6-N-acetylglucosamine synthase-like glycosyltransferase
VDVVLTGAWLRRGVGLVIAAAVAGAAALLWLAVAWTDPMPLPATVQEAFWGPFSLVYSRTLPPLPVVLVAMALALFAIVGVALVTWRFSSVSRASLDHETHPLSPHLIMNATRGRFDGEVTVTVLIPAHNEADRIGATLDHLLGQTRPPDRVIVIADNCTDATQLVAVAAGVAVRATVENEHKKAGGLNQALAELLPEAGHNDLVMVLDADTLLAPEFLAVAVDRFTADRALMALGGVFTGEPGHGILGMFQRNEYARYGRTLRRRRGKVDVLTGTSTLFRPLALRTVAASRGCSLPGRAGDVYDTAALTEDNEVTIALKTLGGLIVSPAECTVVTELMPSWGDLWRQRLRWQRGAVENIGAYGLTPATFRYWAQQLGIGYGTIALTAYLACMAILVLASDTWVWFPFWLGIGTVFAVERVVTAWDVGWAGRALAALLIPELFYDLYLDAIYVTGLAEITTDRTATWGHEHQDHHEVSPAPLQPHEVA